MFQAPKLSLIESEARRLVRRLAEQRLQARQEALSGLCDKRWEEIRGSEPTAPLARSLWRIEPPLAHLFVELFETGDPRLWDVLGNLTAAQGLALVALAEISRGDAWAVRLAYDAMRHFEAGVEQAYIAAAKETARWMSGPQPAGPPKAEGARFRRASPLCQGVAAIVAETGRPDCKAVLETVGFMIKGRKDVADDPQAARIQSALEKLGLAFTRVDHHQIQYTLHGAEKSTTPGRLAEMLQSTHDTK